MATVQACLGVTVDAPTLGAAIDAGLPARALAALSRAARRSSDPCLALQRLLSLAALGPQEAVAWTAVGRHALAAVLAGSEAAARYIAANPALGRALGRGYEVRQRKPAWRMRDQMRQVRAASRDEAALYHAVRTYRVGEWVRIVARMLAGLGSTVVILAELSDLADALVDVLTRDGLRRERSLHGPFGEGLGQGAGFAVLAQGKLGGHELNVSSDIDVQFLYMPQAAGVGALPALHARFQRVAQRLVQGLSRRDEPGFCYRVDVDLRPEGKKGALVNSVAGAEHYYEVWGQSWERLALIRARHVAGAAWVSAAFLQAVRPFVFPRSLDMAAVEEIRALKERVHAERKSHSLRRGQVVGLDIKRDVGCIREVELFVQILQLLHGGRIPELRTPSLVLALHHLHFFGLLPWAHALGLTRAYLFLRDVENALQAAEERQTHRLPDDLAACAGLAQRLRLKDQSGLGLLAQVAAARRRVRRWTRPLFGAGSRLSPAPRRAQAVLRAAAAEQPALLAAMGFVDAQEAAATLAAMANNVGSPFSWHASEKVRRLAAPLLADVATTPDANQALRLLGDLDGQLRKQPAYYGLLRDAPQLRRRLVDLLGSSEFLGRAVIDFPDLIDWLAAARHPAALINRDPWALLDEVLARVGKLDDPELRLRSLRRFKLQEHLRVGLMDLGGQLPVEQVQGQLSVLAEVCLRACLQLARVDLGPRLASAGEGFSILALGRLGGREMGYGSDLDLLFIYDARAVQAADAVRLAQRLIANLTLRFSEGVLYPIDTRLRPSGSQGPLVSSASGFLQYHRERAMLWERQALLRARVVAGDEGLGEQVLRDLDPVRYPAHLPEHAAGEIARLRQRMQQELGREGAARLNLKTGRGGLVDLEFTVQYLQLAHAHQVPALRVTGTLAALHVVGEAGLLPRTAVRALTRAYRFLRRLEMRLRIVHDRAIASLDFASPAAHSVARGMGFADAAELRRRYERVTMRVRRVYNATLGITTDV